jgi:hypothetical protein
MLWARWRYAVVCLAFGLSLIGSKVVHSQDRSIISSTSMARATVSPRPCADRRPVLDTKRERGPAREAGHSDNSCGEPAFERSATGSSGHADVQEKANDDPVLEELKAMGERGRIIMRARAEVLEILEGNNRCAAWFEKAEPDAARKFRSLHYALDEGGPQYSLKIQNAAGQWLYQQPYAASSIEDASAGSTITINGKGAFFQLRPGMHIVPNDGGPTGLNPYQLLRIDHYLGGTLGAQVSALLHEFSHVVGLLPPDGEDVSDRELSTQNTQIMLQHCRAEVETAAKHKGFNLNPATRTFPGGKH